MLRKITLCILIVLFVQLLYAQDNVETEAWYRKIVNRFKAKPSITIPTEERYAYFKGFEGKVIKNIYVKNVDVFNADEDSTLQVVRFVRRLGNKIHFNTDEFHITTTMLFKEGDAVNPLNFLESERILREDKHIYTANIVIEPLEESDYVDVYVSVRDMWTIKVAGGYSPSNKRGNVLVSDVNFLGTGAEFMVNVKKNNEFPQGYNLDVDYKYDMFYHYLTDLNLYYYGNVDDTKYGFTANKNFTSPFTKHLYGITLERERRYTRSVEYNTLSAPFEVDGYQQDIWYAYALPIGDNLEKPGLFNHLIFGGSVTHTDYYKPTDFQGNYAKDNMLYLSNVTFLRRQFYQDTHLFAFGKIEDVPIGLKADLAAGVNTIENKIGNYYGGSLTYSHYNDIFGYHLLNVKSGGYRHSERWENGIFEASSLGISKLINFNDFRWRYYHTIKYSQSINPYTVDNLLTLNDKYDVLGLYIPDAYGVKKLVLNLENNVFLPYKFLNFNTSVGLFVDLGYLAGRDERLFDTTLQSGMGLSIRIKNEHLVFATTQIVLIYYPKGNTHGISNYRYFHDLGTQYEYDQMYYTKPSVYNY